MAPDEYRTLDRSGTGIYKDKGSKFLAFGGPVFSPEEAMEFVEHCRRDHPKARHHCFAYRLGQDGSTYRDYDDGEPSGTAGKPILGQLESQEVTNAVIVVVRYFGGKLLGTSGLIKAYRGAASELLGQTKLVLNTVKDYITIEANYAQSNDVLNLLKQPGIDLPEESYTDKGRWVAGIRQRDAKILTEQLQALDGVTVSYLYSR